VDTAHSFEPDELLYCSEALASIFGCLRNTPASNYSNLCVWFTEKDRSLLDPLIKVRKTLLYADIAESMYLISGDEMAAVQELRALYMQIIEEVIPANSAKLIERVGDGFLIQTSDAASAAKLADQLHQCAQQHSQANTAQRVFAFRIGLHSSDVFSDEKAVYGIGVNLVSRIAANALPGETRMTIDTASELVDGVDAMLYDLGDQYFKHIDEPLRIYKATVVQPRQALIESIERQMIFASKDASAVLQPVLAILPFSNYNDKDTGGLQGAIGLMLADQLINNMSRSPSLKVVSRHSSQQMHQRSVNNDEFAKQLGAQFLVSGHFISDGDKLLINYELRAYPGDRIVLAKQCSGSAIELLTAGSTVNSYLAQTIADELYANLTLRFVDQPLPTMPNYALLLTGIHLLHRMSKRDFARSHEAFTALKERVPLNPIPMAWLARWHIYRANQGWSDNVKADRQKATALIQSSLSINDQMPFLYTVLGQVQTVTESDLSFAEKSIAKAISLNPSDSLAWLQLGTLQSFDGRGELAMASSKRALELSPLDPFKYKYLNTVASAALSARQYHLAEQVGAESLRLNATHNSTIRCLAIANAMLGNTDAAKGYVTQILSAEPDLTVSKYILNSPGRQSGLATEFATALGRCGLPS
jgi:adenylate cyclase